MHLVDALLQKISRVFAYFRVRRAAKRLSNILTAAGMNNVRHLKRAFRHAGEDLSQDTAAASALLTAASYGQYEAVEFLLKRNVQAAAYSPLFKQGETASVLAERACADELVDLLKKYRINQSRAFLDKFYKEKAENAAKEVKTPPAIARVFKAAATPPAAFNDNDVIIPIQQLKQAA